jgi:hemolysin type calcium-binding protein
MGRRIGTGAAIAGLLLILLCAGGASAKGRAKHRTPPFLRAPTCAYTEAGPAGAAGNTLTIKPPKGLASLLTSIELAGREIKISAISVARCTGGTPTLDNIDQIDLRLRKGGLSPFGLNTDLLNGGATPEADGSSEIELNIYAASDPEFLSITGTAANEHFLASPVTGGGTSVNIGPRDAAADLDSDIYLNRGGLDVDGGEGDDLMSAGGEGAPGFPRAGISLHGGAGNDSVIGTAGGDFLDGGNGNDTIDSFAGNDFVFDFQGADTIRTGDGADRVAGVGRGSAVDCGAGRDLAVVSPGSAAVGCERANRKLRGFLKVLIFLTPKKDKKLQKKRPIR